MCKSGPVQRVCAHMRRNKWHLLCAAQSSTIVVCFRKFKLAKVHTEIPHQKIMEKKRKIIIIIIKKSEIKRSLLLSFCSAIISKSIIIRHRDWNTKFCVFFTGQRVNTEHFTLKETERKGENRFIYIRDRPRCISISLFIYIYIYVDREQQILF